MLKPARTVAPAAPIMSLAEAKAHLRVDHADEDAQIAAMVAAVEAHLDGWSGVLGRCILTQTWAFKTAALVTARLPFPDVQSAVVTYLDEAGATQTLPSGNYRLHNDDLGGLIEFLDSVTQPTVADRIDAVTVTAVYGYAAVPQAILAAAKMMLGHLYRDRDGAMDGLPVAVHMLIAPYRARMI